MVAPWTGVFGSDKTAMISPMSRAGGYGDMSLVHGSASPAVTTESPTASVVPGAAVAPAAGVAPVATYDIWSWPLMDPRIVPVAPLLASLPTTTADGSLRRRTVETVASTSEIRPTTAPPASMTTCPAASPSLLPLLRRRVLSRTSDRSRTITRAGVVRYGIDCWAAVILVQSSLSLEIAGIRSSCSLRVWLSWRKRSLSVLSLSIWVKADQ